MRNGRVILDWIAVSQSELNIYVHTEEEKAGSEYALKWR